MLEREKWMSIRNDRKKGLSYAEIGRRHGVDYRTAKKYANSEKVPEYMLSAPKKSILDPYKEEIDRLLEEAPYSAQRILEIITERGYNGKYTVVRQYVSNKKIEFNTKATVRFETSPGLQGQVDWAYFTNHLVVENGKEKKLYCFLMILGYSRNRYIEFVTDMTTQTLLRCHNNAFRYFDGYPDEILYDNMRQVVQKRLLKQKDSTLNSVFEDFAGFYGFKPVLCRPYRGQTKGKVERTVSFVRDNFMTGIKYSSLANLNNQAIKWCDKVNAKVHGTTGKIPFKLLQEEHLNPVVKEFLIDLPKVRKVGKDCLISYYGNKYSVPSTYVDKEVTVRKLGNILTVYYLDKAIAHHEVLYTKNNIKVNPVHYERLTKKQSFNIENTLFANDDVLHEEVELHNLSAYDLEGMYE